jgi:arylsulfatase A-like enzyme
MTKISLLALVPWLAFVPSPLLAAAAAASGNQPNMLFIVSDDQGYGELGCQLHQGAPVNTPHLDRLAREGIRFTQAYSNGHVCAPSRAAFLTGRYPHRFGFHGNGDADPGMPRTEKLLPAYFKAEGYATALIGKWHLGWASDRHPQQFGFDEFFGFLGGEHSYFDSLKGHAGIGSTGSKGDAPIFDGTEPVEKIKYLTEEFTDRAIGFVRRHAAKPFCLYLAYNAVHAPMEVTEDYLARNGGDHRRAMVEALDANLGRLFALLRELGLDRTTFVVFFGDNGGAKGADNGPLRGNKGSYFEGGIRVPAIFRWPERFPAGRVCDVPIMGMDVVPTMLAAAGIAGDRPLDGVSLLPLATGASTAAPRETMHWLLGPNHAVRRGDWKFVRQEQMDFLFNLAADPSEATNLADRQPEKLAELRALHVAWKKELPPKLAEQSKQARKAAAKP